MILLIDNDDSFTYNVVQLLRKVSKKPIAVQRGCETRISDAARYHHIIFSPGPGLPNDFPIMKDILERYDSTKSILGICLGHQAICQYYGGTLRNLPHVVHGVASDLICQPASVLFKGISSMTVGRYHSWVADSLPDVLRVTATDEAGLIMGVEHTAKRVYGIQFHPESYITQEGATILQNFLHGVS